MFKVTRYHIPHKAVQFSAAFLHLLGVQPFLQPQQSSSLYDMLTSGKVVHNGFQLLGSAYPQFVGVGMRQGELVTSCSSSDHLDKLLFGCVVQEQLWLEIARPFLVNNSRRAYHGTDDTVRL